jgi:GNAT superfamily N-acetyltransferase
MRPADLGERLVRHGFEHAGDEIGMAVDLAALPERVRAPDALSIERVRDPAGLATWAATLADGFGEGEREASWVAATYATIGLTDDVPWRHHLATLDGRAVATASLFLGAGVAGVYFVLTVPEARRRGIGGAITLAALHEARAMGFHTGVLQSSEMGEPVYRRLGFREHCRIGIYEWRPADGPR